MGRPGERARRQSAIQRKLDRLADGEPLRILDLFAGCGGISLGFHAAGCRIDAAVEIDERAAATHALNFHGGSDVQAIHGKSRDITKLQPDNLVEELGLGRLADAFDIIVGGPPCQAYTRIGRAKLREIAAHPHAFRVDPRADLYLRYLEYVRATQPLAILIENVPDALNYAGHNVMAEIAEALRMIGYTARYTLINAAFHGVPQTRDRTFLIAYRRELGVGVSLPAATHYLELPSGYNGTRSVALKHVDRIEGGFFIEADHGSPRLPAAVTCEEAIGDLPSITDHLEGKMQRGPRRFDRLARYHGDGRRIGGYARLMRHWPGFENKEGVWDHVIRYLPRDMQTFREMPNGAEYPEAHATAMRILERRIRKAERDRGRHLTRSERAAFKKATVPPYNLGSFPNRWWKLRPNFPSRTLMAHLGKDSYSHIHYDSRQARVISVREAARLQSFPDGFRFCGSMNSALRQIGNAVPPLLAKSLAETMVRTIFRTLKERGGPQRKVRPPLPIAAE
jgi:DNA (cytosine-5)-methyltransferase 1